MKPLSFSQKQNAVLAWWHDPFYRNCEAIICDGAVRSGKTFCLGLSFFLWAMARFQRQQFALCARSVGAVRRNLLPPALTVLRKLGFQVTERVSQSKLTVRYGRRENIFFLFGGKDEASAAGIQGITLAGLLLDEVVLMPRSFVEQACARCSVEGSRLWFSCNPEGPGHWFYQEWIQKQKERRACYFHFTMEDNPALSPRTRAAYRTRFRGTFYRRFVLGEWTAAEGLVYSFFDPAKAPPPPCGPFSHWRISCDYGTVNPSSFGLWGQKNGTWYRVAEYYYDSRLEGRQKTDGEYVKDLVRLASGRKIEQVIVDPSAASFLEALRREGWPVRKADNDVLAGIHITAEALQTQALVICNTCPDILREFGLYRWDSRAGGQDTVRKEYDHAMDDMRYFAMSLRESRPVWSAGWAERGKF